MSLFSRKGNYKAFIKSKTESLMSPEGIIKKFLRAFLCFPFDMKSLASRFLVCIFKTSSDVEGKRKCIISNERFLFDFTSLRYNPSRAATVF